MYTQRVSGGRVWSRGKAGPAKKHVWRWLWHGDTGRASFRPLPSSYRVIVPPTSLV